MDVLDCQRCFVRMSTTAFSDSRGLCFLDRFLAAAGLRFEVDPTNRGVVNVLLGGDATSTLSTAASKGA